MGAVAGGGTLAFTGFYVAGAVMLGLALLLIGALLLRASHFRRVASRD